MSETRIHVESSPRRIDRRDVLREASRVRHWVMPLGPMLDAVNADSRTWTVKVDASWIRLITDMPVNVEFDGVLQTEAALALPTTLGDDTPVTEAAVYDLITPTLETQLFGGMDIVWRKDVRTIKISVPAFVSGYPNDQRLHCLPSQMHLYAGSGDIVHAGRGNGFPYTISGVAAPTDPAQHFVGPLDFHLHMPNSSLAGNRYSPSEAELLAVGFSYTGVEVPNIRTIEFGYRGSIPTNFYVIRSVSIPRFIHGPTTALGNQADYTHEFATPVRLPILAMRKHVTPGTNVEGYYLRFVPDSNLIGQGETWNWQLALRTV